MANSYLIIFLLLLFPAASEIVIGVIAPATTVVMKGANHSLFRLMPFEGSFGHLCRMITDSDTCERTRRITRQLTATRGAVCTAGWAALAHGFLSKKWWISTRLEVDVAGTTDTWARAVMDRSTQCRSSSTTVSKEVKTTAVRS